MIENKSVFTAFAQQFAEQLKHQYNRNIKSAKVRELLSLMAGCASHNQLISQLPKPFEDWQESEALDKLDALLKERHGFTLGSQRGAFMQSVIDGTNATEEALDANSFDVREAWIFYQVTDNPFPTTDGDIHVFVILDAASRYVLSKESTINTKVCPTRDEVENLLHQGVAKAGRWPKLLIVSKDQPCISQIKMAARSFGLSLKKVDESALSGYVDELKEGLLSTLANAADRMKADSTPEDDLVISSSQVDFERGGLTEEAEAKIMGSYLADYYNQWLDTSIPALDDLTPREASKTEEGRQAIEDMFEYMKKLPGNAPKPNFNELRAKLGMPLRD